MEYSRKFKKIMREKKRECVARGCKLQPQASRSNELRLLVCLHLLPLLYLVGRLSLYACFACPQRQQARTYPPYHPSRVFSRQFCQQRFAQVAVIDSRVWLTLQSSQVPIAYNVSFFKSPPLEHTLD
jgi:hypothetical protein